MRIVGYEPKAKIYPAGKRRIKQTIYGGWNGYIGNKRVEEFGESEFDAQYWLEHGQDWRVA